MPPIGTIGNPVIADESREYAVKNVALIKFPEGCKLDNRFLKDILDYRSHAKPARDAIEVQRNDSFRSGLSESCKSQSRL